MFERSYSPMQETSEGRKADIGKLRYSLLPPSIWQVIRVLEYGARKYAPDNWKKVPDAETRYFDALHRHLAAWRAGEVNDEESGLPHIAHVACNALFLLHFHTLKGITTND
jgi:hypothetical protein